MVQEGDTLQRHEAVQVLWRLVGEKSSDFLRQHAAAEKSDRIKQTIEKLIAAPTAVTHDSPVELPAVTIDLSDRPLPEAARESIRKYYKDSYQTALTNYERIKKENEAATDRRYLYTPHKPKEVDPSTIELMIAFIEGPGKPRQIAEYSGWVKDSFADWLTPPEINLVHLLRLAYGTARLHVQDSKQIRWYQNVELENYRARCSPPFGLRELDAATVAALKGKPGAMTWSYLTNNSRYQTFLDWEPDAIWPAFAEMPQILREALAPDFKWAQTYWIDTIKENAFKVLAMFPQLPPEFVPLLWDLAVGESKSWRPLAQAGLATVDGKTAKILVALGDGKQGVRAAAAEWLGKLGDAAAIDPLKDAFRAEKQEAVKGAIMLALDLLGADVDEFLDRKKLLKEAEAGLGKKRPKGMEWVPLDQLPRLHWSDKGTAVDPKIVEWWVVQSVQQKSPVPGPILRRYLDMCKPEETAKLAQFVLRAWIGHDTKTATHEEAAAAATKEADSMWSRFGKHQYYVDHYKGSKDNLYRELLAKHSGQCLGSAINEKGVLALVAAAGDRECVQRSASTSSATGSDSGRPSASAPPSRCSRGCTACPERRCRFSCRSATASPHGKSIYARPPPPMSRDSPTSRQGWTLGRELADRTIPDARLRNAPPTTTAKPLGDEGDAGPLDFGPRSFTVKLNDDLEPVIATEDGKTVKNLPAPGKSDDEEKAKAAKKAFSDAKKSVKEVVKRQSERFYEALCTQRTWTFGDWQTYLARHPIVGRLCSRLVWATFAKTGEAEKFVGCFRLLEDGSLTNEKDDEVHVEPTTIVRLAHTCNVPAELEPAWISHLADYEVEPLFAQFDRPTYALPEEKRKETAVTDFEGYLITTFKLCGGKATKLGYVRGMGEDGGVFHDLPQGRIRLAGAGGGPSTSPQAACCPEQDMPAAARSRSSSSA